MNLESVNQNGLGRGGGRSAAHTPLGVHTQRAAGGATRAELGGEAGTELRKLEPAGGPARWIATPQRHGISNKAGEGDGERCAGCDAVGGSARFPRGKGLFFLCGNCCLGAGQVCCGTTRK